MACYHPLHGYRRRDGAGITFNIRSGYEDLPVTVPCGRCIGCRLDHSRQWAIRCYHEASLHENNSFVTLTYRTADLPDDYSIARRPVQLFMKKLRKKYGPDIKFYGCGEYGGKLGRPHYHLCLFNFEPGDLRLHKVVRGNKLYTSKNLDALWGLGYTITGSVTFQSAAYVARYITKKITGDLADLHYETANPITGEIQKRTPEFTACSNGIGKKWFNQFHNTDVAPEDHVVINGRKMPTPRYYDKLFEQADPKGYARTKAKRRQANRDNAEDNTPARLKVREQVQTSKAIRLKRDIEG